MKNYLNDSGTVEKLYVKNDTLSQRISLHDRFSTNPYGWHNFAFDQYMLRGEYRILEAGCGVGLQWEKRESRLPSGIQIVLSDFSELMLNKAKNKLNHPAFSFIQTDVQSLPFEDGSFDGVIANHMLYHVPDIGKALSEIYRVLKPGGTFYAATNGTNNLLELYQLIQDTECGTKLAQTAAELAFSLENGAAQLKKYFPIVELRNYEDALFVTEAQPLIDYILSMNVITDREIDGIQQKVKDAVRNGGIHIQKSVGLFVCRK